MLANLDFEAGSIISAVFLGGTLCGGLISRLMRKAGEKAVLEYKVQELEKDLNGLGYKFREELKEVDTRLRGELGRLTLERSGIKLPKR